MMTKDVETVVLVQKLGIIVLKRTLVRSQLASYYVGMGSITQMDFISKNVTMGTLLITMDAVQPV